MATGAHATQALEAVVLAAGKGARFGGGKLLHPYGAGVLLDAALATAFAAPVRGVTVVTGADAEAVAAAARAFAGPRPLRLVHAPDYEGGLAHSLRAGLESLPPDTGGAFIFLGDMPRVPHGLLEPLAAALRAGARAAAPVFGGRRGNPVLIARALFPELQALTGDAGARKILDALGDRLALVEAPDDGVLFDVDVRGDLGA